MAKLTNRELANKIISCFDWWELEDLENDTKETFEILERNNKKELQELKDNFINTKGEILENGKTFIEIITELNNRIEKGEF